jgi:hypothetical protein
MKSPIDQMAHVQRHIKNVREMFKGKTQERHVPSGTYDGRELKPFEGRPGAMLAFSLPSLRDGVLVPHTGIKSQCVGKPLSEAAMLPKGGRE